MKNKIFTSVVALIGFVTVSNAQVSATATASARIVEPITIENLQDMNFGNIAVTSTPGTVELIPAAGTAIRNPTGGVTLPVVIGTVQAAQFRVTGTQGYAYHITLPESATLVNGGATMIADDFTASDGAAAHQLSVEGGVDEFYVGATLHVSAGQAAGDYISPGFTVEVNYN